MQQLIGTSIPIGEWKVVVRHVPSGIHRAKQRSKNGSRSAPQWCDQIRSCSRAFADWQQQAELEWIARSRSCRQLVAWFGELAKVTRTASGDGD